MHYGMRISAGQGLPDAFDNAQKCQVEKPMPANSSFFRFSRRLGLLGSFAFHCIIVLLLSGFRVQIAEQVQMTGADSRKPYMFIYTPTRIASSKSPRPVHPALSKLSLPKIHAGEHPPTVSLRGGKVEMGAFDRSIGEARLKGGYSGAGEVVVGALIGAAPGIRHLEVAGTVGPTSV